jgi:hypothetical protein
MRLTIFLSIIVVALFGDIGCSRYETENTAVANDPAFPNTVVIKSCRWVTFDASQYDNMLHIAQIVRLKNGATKSVVRYAYRSIRGSFDSSVKRFLPKYPIDYALPPHSPKWVPNSQKCIPNSPDIEKIIFLVRDSKDNGNDVSWRYFDYKEQDWSKAIILPKLETLPLCADHSEYKSYSSMINEAEKLAEKLDIRSWGSYPINRGVAAF